MKKTYIIPNLHVSASMAEAVIATSDQKVEHMKPSDSHSKERGFYSGYGDTDTDTDTEW